MSETIREKRAAEAKRRLESLERYETRELEGISYYKTSRFAEPDELPLAEFEPCEVGFGWDRNRRTTPDDRREADVDVTNVTDLPDELALGENVWFWLRFEIPESMAGRQVTLRFAVEPVPQPEGGMGPPRLECLCYRDGEPWQAFDDGHEDLVLTDDADGGEAFDLLVEAGTTTLWGLLDVEEFVLDAAELYATRPAVEDLSRNVSILNELQKELPEDSLNRGKILRALTDASHEFSFETDDEAEMERTAEAALERLDDCKADLRSELSGYELLAVGHAHIDLAWLWPWSETVRKGARSFSNVLKLMEEYPEFTFLQSQPHLYELVRNRYPSVFEGIHERVDEGSWHPTGALWVESDINVAGGEALARQYLLGKRYFREEFDVDPTITFIPDVFGYSGGLPGIAQAADCPYFFTQKMSWNEHNDFPHSTFHWEGIDGSSVLSHFPPADTYNGVLSIDQVRGAVTNHEQNDVLDESAYLYGWGDGGGGPTREMLERRTVINEIESLPDIEMGSLTDYFDRLADADVELPTWTGELYLEKHRATLTTQARTKRNNRKGEFALREAEIWSSLALATADDFEYAHADLERAWKVLLFNQFHDILPGSSVTDVYADADRDYEQVFETTDATTTEALDALVDGTDESDLVSVTNSLPWSRDPVVELEANEVTVDADAPVAFAADGTELPVQRVQTEETDTYLFQPADVPAFGITTVEFDAPTGDASDDSPDDLEVSKSHLENARLRVEFEEDGTITAYDREADRQLFDGTGNRLVRYRDHPEQYDAWDVEGDLYEVGEDLPTPSSVEVVETGPVRATVRQTREFGDSTLVQDVSLERDSERIDVRTEVEWREDEEFLKVHFPMNVHATEATYDTHFGHIERPTHDNTSWDVARYEEPHRQWVDVSEHDYGIAVLNDCKYGVHVDGTDVGLSLLRAPTYPDPEADRGHHEFRYAVFPHEDDLRDGGVVEAGYDVNTPVHTVPVEEKVEYAPLEVDTPGVVVESIKRAESSDGRLVVRLFEAWGRETDASLSFGFPVESAAEANLVEDRTGNLAVEDGTIDLDLEAFDIRTLVLELP
ncbi:glycoside hydrolase family 38 C-terminal domain-containing protein [Halomontanus rarus]|uniref:glycoside hydrolase family 38 N-terminal domain-containing protein n=1 Tax=Halomontanus rarus TaxID=3034020 RepID=UPI001A999B02